MGIKFHNFCAQRLCAFRLTASGGIVDKLRLLQDHNVKITSQLSACQRALAQTEEQLQSVTAARDEELVCDILLHTAFACVLVEKAYKRCFA